MKLTAAIAAGDLVAPPPSRILDVNGQPMTKMEVAKKVMTTAEKVVLIMFIGTMSLGFIGLAAKSYFVSKGMW